VSGVFRRLLCVCVCVKICVGTCVLCGRATLSGFDRRESCVCGRVPTSLHFSTCRIVAILRLFQSKLQCHVGACAWASFICHQIHCALPDPCVWVGVDGGCFYMTRFLFLVVHLDVCGRDCVCFFFFLCVCVCVCVCVIDSIKRWYIII